MPGPDITSETQGVSPIQQEKRIPPKPNTRRHAVFQKRAAIQARDAAIESDKTSQRQLAKTREELLTEQQGRDIDPMTGILTQKGFDRRIKEEIARAKRTGDKVALMFFDLNGLKKVNDDLGHDVGDERIKAAANILTTSVRPTDVVARKGERADEFLVALPLKNMSSLRERYAEIHATIQAANQNWEGYPITFPAGAVEMDLEDVEGSIRAADHAMYQAKERSKEIGKDVIYVEPTARKVA
ncbi:MAG: GGDEF domain-containing protein [Patescibacteria group bacterium]